MKRNVRRGEHSCDIQRDRIRGHDRGKRQCEWKTEMERRKKEAVNMRSIRERKATKPFFSRNTHK